MDRTRFYVEESVNSIREVDFLYNNISKFVMKYSPGYYRVDESDIMRPDMISYKNYGTVRYWWLLMFINEIEDSFNDLYVGQLLTIPNLLDVYDFYKRYRVR